jgi:hypothetical protein
MLRKILSAIGWCILSLLIVSFFVFHRAHPAPTKSLPMWVPPALMLLQVVVLAFFLRFVWSLWRRRAHR